MSSRQPTVEHCDHPACAGAPLQDHHCLEHLTAEEFDAAVARLRGGEPINARNTTISSEPLKALLDALKSDDDRPILPAADFRGATFSGYAVFSEATFTDIADFDEATFSGYAPFRGATFSGDARFRDATFSGDARFAGATFNAYAGFDGVTFSGDADFDRLTFSGDAGFRRASFSGDARFADVTFSGDVRFAQVTFSGDADFRGTSFSGDADFYGTKFRGDADFDGINFGGDARFRRASFSRYAGFAKVNFSRDATFRWTSFGGDARFAGATFDGDADFYGATFDRQALFNSAAFAGGAVVGDVTADLNSEFSTAPVSFNFATFNDDADFRGTTFAQVAAFVKTTFSRDAVFDGASFSADAVFRTATFGAYAAFNGTTFIQNARFTAATFARARHLGPLIVNEHLVLDECVFVERITIQAAAAGVSAHATIFTAGVHLWVRWAEIALHDADFARASILSGATTWELDSDLPPGRTTHDRQIELVTRPRLITLRGAHVAALSLANVDLRACRFFGAHGLESLSIEASCSWSRTPRARRYIDRETIAEEHHWRGSSWKDPSTQAPEWLEGRDGSQEPLEPAQLAALYRALRKAREDHKDEAGAADLYYGEMEMRRHSPSVASEQGRTRARSHRAILHTYWLLSGYGLRPVRAAASLALTLLGGAALLYWFGFHEPRNYGRSLMFAIESSLSLLRPPQSSLTAGGEVVQITLRLLGPLLFGLVVLAVRAHVKR